MKAELLKALGFALPDGVYRLVEDVKNPKPDKRCRGQFDAAPVWKTGLTIVVRSFKDQEHRVPELRAFGPELTGSMNCHEDADYGNQGWRDIVTKLIPARPCLRNHFLGLKEVHGVTNFEPVDLLCLLLDKGTVKMDDLIQAAKVVNEFEESEYETFRARHGF